jgi:hypothetical protein
LLARHPDTTPPDARFHTDRRYLRFVYAIFTALEGISPKRCKSDLWPLVGPKAKK